MFLKRDTNMILAFFGTWGVNQEKNYHNQILDGNLIVSNRPWFPRLDFYGNFERTIAMEQITQSNPGS